MKKITIITICFVLLFVSSCKKDIKEEKANQSTAANGSINMDASDDGSDLYEPTLKDRLFRFGYDDENAIVQTMTNGNTITLMPYAAPKEIDYHLYIVLEENASGSILNHAFILSENSITTTIDLESWVIEPGKVYKCEEGQLSNPLQKKLMAHYDGADYDAETLYKNAIITPPADTPVCIDWYWTTWNADTGEIIDQVYLFTDCGGWGGGGSTGSGSSGNNNNNQQQFDTIATPQTSHPMWHVGPKISWYTLFAAEHLRGISYQVVGTPTPSNPMPVAPNAIFTSATTGNITFSNFTMYNFTWTTSTHTANMISDSRTECFADGTISDNLPYGVNQYNRGIKNYFSWDLWP